MTFETKRCRKCALEKPINAFSHDKSRSDGHQNTCRDCQSIIAKQAYQRRKATMTNEFPANFICNLDKLNRHRLVYDAQQWMIQRRNGKNWRTLAYIGSNSENLLKVIGWKQIDISKSALELIMSFPPFLEWIKTVDATPLQEVA